MADLMAAPTYCTKADGITLLRFYKMRFCTSLWALFMLTMPFVYCVTKSCQSYVQRPTCLANVQLLAFCEQTKKIMPTIHVNSKHKAQYVLSRVWEDMPIKHKLLILTSSLLAAFTVVCSSADPTCFVRRSVPVSDWLSQSWTEKLT